LGHEFRDYLSVLVFERNNRATTANLGGLKYLIFWIQIKLASNIKSLNWGWGLYAMLEIKY
jgi:hypothetical protein